MRVRSGFIFVMVPLLQPDLSVDFYRIPGLWSFRVGIFRNV